MLDRKRAGEPHDNERPPEPRLHHLIDRLGVETIESGRKIKDCSAKGSATSQTRCSEATH